MQVSLLALCVMSSWQVCFQHSLEKTLLVKSTPISVRAATRTSGVPCPSTGTRDSVRGQLFLACHAVVSKSK